jgi:hypothetical protein
LRKYENAGDDGRISDEKNNWREEGMNREFSGKFEGRLWDFEGRFVVEV